MKESLIQWLQQYPEEHWHTYGEGESAEDITKKLADYGKTFPEDYVEFFQHYGAIEVHAEEGLFHIYSLDDATELSEEPDNMIYIPGMFIIGGDGGANFYYYDPFNKLGKGHYAIFFVGRGNLSYETSQYVGSSLVEVCKKLAEGVSFWQLPELGDEGDVPEVPQFNRTVKINNMQELLQYLPTEIQHPTYGKGVLNLKESTKNDGSPYLSGGYNLENDEIVFFTFGSTHQGIYDAMAPYLFIKGLLNQN